ncbi:unnamed protein product [Rotaria socialis]|uniref:G-protein coupled receptors family 1 profile domain-containing protein n=1 Tax=Rotaria socialis TaxID=392032 RepID=A0A818TGG2_9BILA|nr:unnamed protein product [Rotaria socialis]CAF3384764.1 unnamed protein product [Rotaria socialis]CAF3564674.1 unnamed protein product [Rotaria socialis]CAF3676772.1 unnamed protein product [Rotaria socialis]CAF3686689.1 unnamed protein product [Rotaria socialis]
MNNETNETAILAYVYRIETIFLPAIIVFGTLCNIMTFIVMRRRRMRISSTCFYMAVLAVTDTFVLWTGCLNQWLYLMQFPTLVVQSNFTCKSVPFLFVFFADASVWITVCMSFERYFAVSRPLRASQMCTTRRAKWVLVVIFAVLALIDGHYLITLEIQKIDDNTHVCHPTRWAHHFVQKIFVYIDGLKYSAIPFFLLLLLSILIIQRVFHAESISAQLRNLRQLNHYQKYSLASSSSISGHSSLLMANSTQPTSLNNTRVGRRITFMLLSVSIAFCVFSAPMSLMQIVQSVSSPDHNFTALAIGKAVAELCQYINHSCNFFLYALTGRIFRREFVRLFFPTRFGNGIRKPAGTPRTGLNGRACLIPHAGHSSSHHGSLYSMNNNRQSLYQTSRRLTAFSLKQNNTQVNKLNFQSFTIKSPLICDRNGLSPASRHLKMYYDKSQILANKNSSDSSPLYSLWNLFGRNKKRELIGDRPLLFVKALKPTHHQFQGH